MARAAARRARLAAAWRALRAGPRLLCAVALRAAAACPPHSIRSSLVLDDSKSIPQTTSTASGKYV